MSTKNQRVKKNLLNIKYWVHPSPGLPGLDARFWTRGEETGVSIVSTFTSGMTADRSVEARAVLASFSRMSLASSVPLFFSEFFTAGSNFWAIISCSMKQIRNLAYVTSGKIPEKKKNNTKTTKSCLRLVKLTFLSAGGVVGGGVIAKGEGRVAVRAAVWEITISSYSTIIQLTMITKANISVQL